MNEENKADAMDDSIYASIVGAAENLNQNQPKPQN